MRFHPVHVLLVVGALLLAACSGKDSGRTEFTSDELRKEGKVHVIEATGEKLTGTLVSRNAGTLVMRMVFQNGLAEGAHEVWYGNGQLKLKRTMAAGEPHGLEQQWHPNGKPKLERQWAQGQPAGNIVEWSADGQQEWLTKFENGVAGDRKIVRNDDLTLPEVDRKYLWETEHHGTWLGKFGFGALKKALAAGDREGLAALLAKEFSAKLPDGGAEVMRDLQVAQAARFDADAGQLQPANATEFVAWLMAHRATFAGKPDLKASMISLAPVDHATLAGDWRGVCKFHLRGKGHMGGPREAYIYLDLTMRQPSKENLEAGGWLRAVTITRVKRAAAQRPLMEEVSAKVGLHPDRLHDNWKIAHELQQMNTGGIYFCDWNHDGCEDCIITDAKLKEGLLLYNGTADGKFVEATAAAGLAGLKDDIGAFVDLDGDGWEDLVSLSGRVYRNAAGKKFENLTAQSNLKKVGGLTGFVSTAKIAVADYDRDGRLDLYVFRGDSNPTKGSWIDGQIGSGAANQLLRNTGNWQFADVTEATQTDGGRRSTFTSAWLDADNNGWPDIYVINEYGNGVLLRNQGAGKPFKSRELIDRAADFGSMGLSAGDINNDGHIDLYVASMYSKAGSRVIGNLRPNAYEPEVMAKLRRMVAGSQMYLNHGANKFEPVGKAVDVVSVGWAYGPTLADLDNDGFLDIYAPTGFISRTRDKPDG